MKGIIKLSAVLMCVLSMVFFMSACSIEDIEEKKGISYENIVCKMELSPCYGFCCGRYSIFYTLYADNRLVVHTGAYDYNGVQMDVIVQKEFQVTEEQKQGIIQTIRDCKIMDMYEINNEEEGFAIFQYIYLYDEEGNEVHKCGGINPPVEEFETARVAIFDLIPYDEYTGLIDDTYETIHTETDRKKLEDMGISFDDTVVKLCSGTAEYLPEEDQHSYEFTVYADNTVEVSAVVYDDKGKAITLCSTTFELSDQLMEQFVETVRELIGVNYLHYSDYEIDEVFEDGIRPTDKFVPWDENVCEDIDFGDSYSEYIYEMVFYDSKGRELYLWPMTYDDIYTNNPTSIDAMYIIYDAIGEERFVSLQEEAIEILHSEAFAQSAADYAAQSAVG